MNNILEIESLKIEIKKCKKLNMELLHKLDQIKIKLTSNEKVTKSEIIKIIDEEVKL